MRVVFLCKNFCLNLHSFQLLPCFAVWAYKEGFSFAEYARCLRHVLWSLLFFNLPFDELILRPLTIMYGVYLLFMLSSGASFSSLSLSPLAGPLTIQGHYREIVIKRWYRKSIEIWMRWGGIERLGHMTGKILVTWKLLYMNLKEHSDIVFDRHYAPTCSVLLSSVSLI